MLNSFFGLRLYIAENRVGRKHDNHGVESNLDHRLTSIYLVRQQMVTIETDVTSLLRHQSHDSRGFKVVQKDRENTGKVSTMATICNPVTATRFMTYEGLVFEK